MLIERNGSPVNNAALVMVSPGEGTNAVVPDEFGHHAYRIIQKNFRKIIKCEKAVLKDTDPEPLHQMRVGMRRLRAALHASEGSVKVPKAGRESVIKTIARCLGDLRDLDVLIEILRQHYYPLVNGKARRSLDTVLKKLHKKRKKRFALVKKMLKGDRYRAFKAAYKDWLAHPHYGAIASYSLSDVLPDVLAPTFSSVFLHPGWLFAVIPAHVPLVPSRLSSGALQKALTTHSETLHSLRKDMKRLRYQTEFFEEFCPPLQPYIEDFKDIQDLLGQLQDCAVLRSTMATCLGKHWSQRLPVIARLIQDEEEIAWQGWQPYQAKYLNPELRHELRLLVVSASTQTETALPHRN